MQWRRTGTSRIRIRCWRIGNGSFFIRAGCAGLGIRLGRRRVMVNLVPGRIGRRFGWIRMSDLWRYAIMSDHELWFFLAGALLLNRGEGAEGHTPAQSRLAPAQKFLTTVILRICLSSAVLLSRGEGTEGHCVPNAATNLVPNFDVRFAKRGLPFFVPCRTRKMSRKLTRREIRIIGPRQKA
jgi:hypothetical protein